MRARCTSIRPWKPGTAEITSVETFLAGPERGLRLYGRHGRLRHRFDFGGDGDRRRGDPRFGGEAGHVVQAALQALQASRQGRDLVGQRATVLIDAVERPVQVLPRRMARRLHLIDEDVPFVGHAVERAVEVLRERANERLRFLQRRRFGRLLLLGRRGLGRALLGGADENGLRLGEGARENVGGPAGGFGSWLFPSFLVASGLLGLNRLLRPP